MINPIDELEYTIIRLDPNDLIFQRAIKEYYNYEFRYQDPYIKLRKKIDPDSVYTVKLSYEDTETLAKCSGPSYVTGKVRPCKHCFIVLLNFIGKYLEEHPLEQWNEAMKCMVLDDLMALSEAPNIDEKRLNQAFNYFTQQIGKAPQVVPKDQDHWEPKSVTEQEQTFRETVAKLPSVQKETAIAKASPAFGGRVGDLPTNLVITLHGKPYVTKAGLVYAASQMGLKSIETEPCQWSWENDDGKSVFKATVTFKDGRSFTAYGVAIPDQKNVTNPRMFPFIDHLAETRAIGRALRNGIAFAEPSIEEMPEYGGDFE